MSSEKQIEFTKENIDTYLKEVAKEYRKEIGKNMPAEMILIGGGVSSQEKLLIDPLREKVRAQLMPRFSEKLQIEAAALGNDAGMIGAAAFWMEKH